MHHVMLGAVAALLATSATAATIRVGGRTEAGTIIPIGQVTTVVGAAEERFDGPGFPSDPRFAFSQVNLFTEGVLFDYRIAVGNETGRYLAPTADESAYISVGSRPFFGRGVPNVLEVTFASLAGYAGFYWGSIDEYNSVSFLSAAGNPIFVDDFGYFLDGEQVASALGVPLYSSFYLDFFAGSSPSVKTIRFTSTNAAFEIDNIAFATDRAPASIVVGDAPAVQTPAPGGVALAGLATLAVRRRRISRRG